MMEAGKRQAMATIVLESERLLNLARASGSSLVAGLIQAVVDEARATLAGQPSKPTEGGPEDPPPGIVSLRPRAKPRLN